MSRCHSGDESGEDSDNSSTDSFEHATPSAVSPTLSGKSLVLCKFNISLEPESWVVSEEVSEVELKSSSSLQCKLQRQLQSMGLQTKSLHGANLFESRSTDSFEHRAPRALNSPVFCKFNIPLEPEASEEVSEDELKSSSSLTCKLQRQLHSIGLQTKSLHGANHV